jgi:hypothetical protein
MGERERVEPREQRVAAQHVDVGEPQLGQPSRREQQHVHELLGRGAHARRRGADALRAVSSAALASLVPSACAGSAMSAPPSSSRTTRGRRLPSRGASEASARSARKTSVPVPAWRSEMPRSTTVAGHSNASRFHDASSPRERANACTRPAEPGREQQRHDDGDEQQQCRGDQQRARQRGEAGHGAARLRSRRGACEPRLHWRHRASAGPEEA